jgi:hypothetical protein
VRADLAESPPESGGKSAITKGLHDSSSKPSSRVTTGIAGDDLRRPGFRFAQQDAAARDEKRLAHEEYLDFVENAWKRDAATDRGDNPSGVSDRVKADAAMTMDQIYSAYDRAAENEWATDKGKSAVRDASRGDGMTRDEAYAQYDRELEQAYRNPSE